MLATSSSRNRNYLTGLYGRQRHKDLRDDRSKILNTIPESNQRDNRNAYPLHVLLKLDT
jgi:hypothetical protein